MKALRWVQLVPVSALLIMCMSGPTVSAAMPVNEYACKVVTIGGQLGVVLVQADTRELAAKAASGAQAFTLDNGRGTATSVVECIERGKEQFADYQFQQFFQSIPL